MRKTLMTTANKTLLILFTAILFAAGPAMAKTVKVDIHCIEHAIDIDNKGTKYDAWTYGGTMPGPVVRVTEGDTVDFTLLNDAGNGYSHSMDFHAAVVDVLDEFETVKPGSSKNYSFVAKYPGVFMYHCGASNMSQHIAKGMFGIIIVDPKEGYTKNYPKPDREYVLVQSQYFPSGSAMEITDNIGNTASLINGKIFHYDPLHGVGSAPTLESKPGELVRIFFVNANINNPVAFHPIAGIWERVYLNGNPKNVIYGMQTYGVAPAEAATFDLVSPAGRTTHNALVDHTMKAAHHGAITILTNSPEADPKMGKGDNILPR